jgi:signal transduction histidine kinase
VRRKGFLLFFFSPFIGILIIFFVFSTLNRSFIQDKTESLVQEQLAATAEIFKVNLSHLLDEGYLPEDILGMYEGEENIYYFAILDEKKNILAWSSRYEGYLPFSSQDSGRTEPWVLSSPVGKISNRLSPFNRNDGKVYYLYLGYSLRSLEEMTARSNRDSLLMFSFLVAVGVVFFLGVFELQKKYLAKTKEAEEAHREKERFREISAFTSAVAHEIKNPLNSLSLLFELLQRNVPADVKEEVAVGKAELQKIARIIDWFSDSLKPLRPNMETAPLREVVMAAHDALLQEAPKPEVEWRYSESRPVFLNADKNLMVQCFLNLLRNAYEATDRGIVSVKAETRRKKVFVHVSDTGRGIEPDRLSRVFDPFFTSKDKGMGIGLYLARKIIEAHDGRIGVESPPGRGTTFTIQLPGGRHE